MRQRVVKTIGGVAAVVGIPLLLSGSQYQLETLALLGFWATLAGSWNILAGYVGQISLGHAAFSGIGAYSAAIVYTAGGRPVWEGAVIGIGIAALVSMVVGAAGLRMRGPYFTIATIALAQVMAVLARNWVSLTEGSEGIYMPFDPKVQNLMFTSRLTYAILNLGMASLVVGLMAFLGRTRVGLSMRAVRNDDAAASSLGVRAVGLKLLAFVLSAAIAALAGAVNAARIGYVDPTGVLSLAISLKAGLVAVIGGMGRPMGPFVGALFVIPLESILRARLGGSYGALHLAIYGVLVIGILRVAPGGLIELGERAWRKISSSWQRRGAGEVAG